MHDVVVIGGGPVGSQVACRLAGLGYGVLVLEQKERLGEPVCCTGIIGQECVNSFDIDDSVILRRVNSAKVLSPSGKLLSLWRQEPQACIIDRAAFDVSLANRARRNGVDYSFNSPVNNIDIGDNGVRVELASHRREPESFEARAVVIANGCDSKLLDGVGLGRTGDFVIGAQAEVTTIGVDEVEIYLGQEIAPSFFAWLVPTSPNRALVGLLSRRSPGLYLKKFLLSLLARRKIASAEVEVSYRGIALKSLARTYGQRLMVVGSAAGQIKPINGGGIYYGLLCADLAADSLDRALQSDDLSARNLADYQRQWKRKLGWELKMGYWARRLYRALSDKQIDRIFDIIGANGIDKALLKADDLSFDWHGGVVLRLIGHRALSKVTGAIKTPFPSGGRG